MMMLSALFRWAIHHVSGRDPEGDAFRRAIRAAIVVPLAAGFSFVVNDDGYQAPLFTLIGAFWLMILADFPGNRQNRAVAYCGLGFNGAVLITVGTLVAPIPWLAVTLMFILGIAVTLSGVLSETISAGQRVTLLCYVLSVCTPAAAVGERLWGWAIALAFSIPGALFLLPPRHHSDLRRHAAQVCTALADRMEGVGSASELSCAMDALRATFLGANFRPVGLTAGSRALARVVDDLEWLASRLDENTATVLTAMTEPAVKVLRCCSRVLDVALVAQRTRTRTELALALDELHITARGHYKDDVIQILAEPDDAAAAEIGRAVLTRRTIATTVGLTGRIIAAAAAADARPVWARVLGRQLPSTGVADRLLPEPVAFRTITSGFLTTGSVAARNALRTGVGLALAVAATHLFLVQHGFWVVLGTIVVMGSSALNTGTKLIRAVVGTAIGVVVGAVLITAVGTDSTLLAALLPVAVFASAYVPRVGSFIAGQAAITMTVLIIYNLLAPVGWRVGLLRIEDIAAGAAIAVVASLLLWPRGAAVAVHDATEAALDVGSRYLHAAVLRITRGSSDQINDNVIALSHDALVASRTLDDALRHFLSETGTEADLRSPVVRGVNRATLLRGAADIIADITYPPPLHCYPLARAVLEAHTESVSERLTHYAGKPRDLVSDEFVRALRAESSRNDAAVNAAGPLVVVAASLGELELIYPETADAVVGSG